MISSIYQPREGSINMDSEQTAYGSYLTVRQAAKSMNYGPNHVYKLIKDGKLKAVGSTRLRIREDWIDQYMLSLEPSA